MHDIVKKIQHDHHHFHVLINLIYTQINALRTGEMSDYQWLIDGMRLIKRYMDVLHQPVEALFHEKLLRRAGRAYPLLKPLLNEDRIQFNAHCCRFTHTLSNAMYGVMAGREVLATYGEDAINDLRRQILFEEQAVLPFANRLFTPADWTALEVDIRNWRNKPLLENALRDDCRNLFLRLQH